LVRKIEDKHNAVIAGKYARAIHLLYRLPLILLNTANKEAVKVKQCPEGNVQKDWIRMLLASICC
jgi:hypothetical protein